CTSAGLANDDLEIDLAAVDRDAIVATLVYSSTKLLERAAARGYSTLDGKAMLVHQAAHAFTIWTGVAAPVAVMHSAIA
ncbi:MAG TPA: hypothetical protein VGC41_16495, partial [Kofleriaceae bacterium]